MIHIYCGDGKGKTTAALGLVLRASGAGMRVRFVQLLKGGHTSELAGLAGLPGVTVCRCDRDYGFTFRMTDADRAAITACHNTLLRDAMQAVQEGTADLLVLDEFCAAYNTGLLDRALAERLVLEFPPTAELVLTGREPAQIFLDAADYISEIRAVRHPYTKGIAAREGIEY